MIIFPFQMEYCQDGTLLPLNHEFNVYTFIIYSIYYIQFYKMYILKKNICSKTTES